MSFPRRPGGFFSSLFFGVWLALFLSVLPVCGQGPVTEDVANHFFVRTAHERTTLDRQTGELISTVDVSLWNLGGRTLFTPLHLLVSLDTNGISMPGAAGGPALPPYNVFYKDLSGLVTGGTIPPNARIDTTLTFVRGRDVPLAYSLAPRAILRSETAPTVTVSALSYNVDEGQTLQFGVTGSDPDGDVVVLLAAPGISNAVFAATSGVAAAGTFTFNPDFDQQGKHTLKFTARDPLGLEGSALVEITVNNVNRPPTLAPLEARTLQEGQALLVQLEADDPDGDPLILVGDPLPANAIFSSETRTFLFAPDFAQAGPYEIAFSAHDGALGSSTQLLSISVEDVPLAAPGDTNQLTLVVDPVQSPTLLAIQRVTGAVNVGTNVEPKQPATAALITGLSPVNARQGQSTNVVIAGQAAGLFATHFDESSQAFFGAGVQVNGLTVLSATQAVAAITVNSDAEQGIRNVTVVTSNETAISLVAFKVDPGLVTLTGKLIDSDTSNAVANAIITVEGTGFTTMSLPDGTFSLIGIPAGPAVLIINPPNHELIRVTINTTIGQTFDLGALATPATVFDPSAPASVSLLSVLGRGLGSYDTTDLARMRQTIRDALLLVGGDEGGVMDEFGNQTNPQLIGPGLVSILPKGVDRLADRVDRGESVSLADILFPFSHGFTWTNGPPPTLAEWMDTLQLLINQAWADPNNPNYYLPILIFNRATTLLTEPPPISPATRLNAPQTYLFVMSMLGLAAAQTDPQFADLKRTPAIPRASSWWLFVPAAHAADPPPTQDRRMTTYWRGFSQAKNNFFSLGLNMAASDLAKLSGVMAAVAGSADLRVGLLALPMIGHLGTELVGTLGSLAMAARVPEAPRILRHEIFEGPRHQTNEPGVPRVRIHFQRSQNDPRDGRYLYSLYRFRHFSEGRQLVTFDSFHQAGKSNLAELALVDLAPFPGSTFYALTVSRLYTTGDEVSDNQLNNALPFWNAPIAGINPIGAFLSARQMIVSDYSDPVIVYVGSAASSIPISFIELDSKRGRVYYSDPSGEVADRKIFEIDLLTGDPGIFHRICPSRS
jgi:hypothetical protein